MKNKMINLAKEQHINEKIHEKWGGDFSSIGRAMISGAITGAAVGYGMDAGKFLGNLAGNTLTSTLGTTTANATATAINTATVSYVTTIGNAMSQTTLNGGSLGDVLKAGGKTATSGDTLKSIVISGATAGLMTGLTEYVDVWTNGAVSGGNLKINPNATFSQRFTSALYESAITTTTNTAMQSLFNKEDSFKDILKRQAVNTGVGALANIGAQEIGKQYHSGNLKMGMNGTMGNLIGKTTQLTLHAGLGALSNKLTGNDVLSGAVSGVSGEIFGELLGNTIYGGTDNSTIGNLTKEQRNTLIQYGGLAGGLSALITGKVRDLNANEIANNIFAGQMVGSNAVENNLTMYVHGTWSDKYTFTEEFKDSFKFFTKDEKEGFLEWTGDNINEAREVGAENIDDFIKNYEFAPGEPLNIVGHSHGGNVIKLYSNLVDGEIFGKNGTKPSSTTAYLFATPNLNSPTMKEGVFDKYYNIYNKNDILTQDWMGGINTGSWLDIFYIKNPSQKAKEPNATNISVKIDNTHKYTNDNFNNILKPNGGTFENYFNLIYNMSKGQVENHTDMKTPETVNVIYNYKANKYNQIQKDLNNYRIFNNFINKN